jgi:hypothetical protein
MSKKQSRRNNSRRAGWRKSRVAALIILALVCVISTSLLAQVGLQRRGKRASGEVSVMSLSGPPAKEYIYAGGKLIATEEAASSGCVSPPSPGNTLLASAQTATSVVLNWAPSSDADHYEVQRRQSIAVGSDWATLSPNPGNNTFTDNGVGVVANTAYLYRVRAVDAAGGCPSSYSNTDLATTTIFTDDPLVVQMTIIQAVHLTQLRTAVNAVRATAALPAFNWTDLTDPPSTETPVSGGRILKDQVQKLRSKLNQARNALGLASQPYTNEPLNIGDNVYAAHIQQLRDGVK